MKNTLDALNEVCAGWSESRPGGLVCNPGIAGGIIDSEILSGEWFVIFNDSRESLDGFESREAAVAAFVSASRMSEIEMRAAYYKLGGANVVRMVGDVKAGSITVTYQGGYSHTFVQVAEVELAEKILYPSHQNKPIAGALLQAIIGAF